MDNRGQASQDDDLGWGWSRANVIACAVLGLLVLGLILWQWSSRTHYLGADIEVEEHKVEASSARIDPNIAGVAELMAMPGIGPALADRIVSYRRDYQGRHGPEARAFAKLDDLQKVKGIGPRTAEKMEPYLEFQEATPDRQ